MNEAELAEFFRCFDEAEREVASEAAKGKVTFRWPSQRVSEVRRRTVELVAERMPRFADNAEWLLATGQWRAGGEDGRPTRTYAVWTNSRKRGYVLADRWTDERTGFLVFALEFGSIPTGGALCPIDGLLDHEHCIVKLDRRVGQAQVKPTDAELAEWRGKIVRPALAKHGREFTGLFNLDGPLAVRGAAWRSLGVLGEPWLSLPQYRAAWALVAYLLDHGLVPDEGEELFREDPARPFEPGNVGVRGRGENRYYRRAASVLIEQAAA